MKKKRVLHLLASNSYSGAENVVCNIIESCNDEYDMYYSSKDGSIRDILNGKHIKFVPYQSLNVRNIRKIVRDYHIDIIHAHDFKASFIASFLKNECKIVSHLHCNYKLLKLKSLVSFVYSIVQKNYSKVIVVSDEILNVASFGEKIRYKTIVLPNVVDSKKVEKLAREFKCKDYDLVFLGRLIELKQPLLFLDIVKEIKKKFPGVKACVIGNGEMYSDCLKKIKDDELVDNVDMLGFQKNPFPYVKHSKVAVLPSKFEGLPMSVIECMILDTLVVNSGVGGLKDMYLGYEKYICHNLDEYVNCILKLLKKDKMEYHDDCQKIVHDYVNVFEYAKKIKGIYQDICD